MKYMSRAGIYKASNVSFDPDAMIAKSYDWWHFVARINGKVVFNNHNYSPSTNRHQSKVRSVMDSLGIKIDLIIDSEKSLSNPPAAMEDARERLVARNSELWKLIEKPRTHKATNMVRTQEILMNIEKIKEIYNLANMEV